MTRFNGTGRRHAKTTGIFVCNRAQPKWLAWWMSTASGWAAEFCCLWYKNKSKRRHMAIKTPGITTSPSPRMLYCRGDIWTGNTSLAGPSNACNAHGRRKEGTKHEAMQIQIQRRANDQQQASQANKKVQEAGAPTHSTLQQIIFRRGGGTDKHD